MAAEYGCGLYLEQMSESVAGKAFLNNLNFSAAHFFVMKCDEKNSSRVLV